MHEPFFWARVDVEAHVVHRFGHRILALEVHPNGPVRNVVDHLPHLYKAS